MRPLHRPMFRYGGPIKEGVMSGIREPHARGSIAGGNQIGTPMGNRTGFANPKDKLVMGIASKVLPKVGLKPGFMKPWWNKIKKTFGTTAQVQPITKVTKTPVTKWSGPYKGTTPGGTGYQASGPIQKVWTPKGWVARDPTWKIGSKIYEGKGYIGKPIKGLYNLAKTPTGGIGLVYVGTKWLWPDGKPANENEINEHLNTGGGQVPGHGDEGMKGDGSWFAEQEKIAADKKREERIQKYRDIMDIKGMNKDAAYDSLIAASKLVTESTDIKQDLKSGKLINQIISGASKAFDKPKKTKDAIDTLILKGEIEKDLYAAKPTEAEKTAAAFGISKDEYKKKLLGKDSAAQIIASISTKTGRVDSTTVASGYKASGIVPKATITDTIVDEWIDNNKGKTEIDYVKDVISKEPDFVPGIYVVGDRAVITDGTNFQYDY